MKKIIDNNKNKNTKINKVLNSKTCNFSQTIFSVLISFVLLIFIIIFFLSNNVSADKEFNDDFHNIFNRVQGPYQSNGVNITFRGPVYLGKGQLISQTLVDLDNDGDIDIIITLDDGNNHMFYFENQGTFENPKWIENSTIFEGIEHGPCTLGDLDDDGDLDLIISNKYYENTGSSENPEWTENNSVLDGVADSGVPYLVDLDYDDDLDLIIGSNFYNNTGTKNEPEWVKDNSVLSGIELEGDIRLAFGDLDNDLDLDLAVGNGTDEIYYYENTGTSKKSEWKENISMFSELDQILYLMPSFNDIDNDGDIDLVIGGVLGEIYYYENIGTQEKPEWGNDKTLFSGISMKAQVKPTFADLDNDSDFDLIIGESNGELRYYENIGTKKLPVWSENTSMFNEILYRENPSPVFTDLDDDEDLDLIIGGQVGDLFYYNNTGTPEMPEWREENSKFAGVTVPENSSPVFSDLDGDGDYDLTIGESQDNLNFYENTGTKEESEWIESTMYSNLDVGFNNVPTFVNMDGDDDYDLTVGDDEGNLKYFENTGTKNEAKWNESIDFFSGIETCEYIVPAFADLDSDGDIDLAVPLSNSEHSVLIFYENLLIQYPRAFIDNIYPNPANESDNLLFEGHAIATDNEISRYVWSSSIDNEFYNDTIPTFFYDKLSNGTHIIKLKIEDKFGWWSMETSKIMHVNGIPRARIDEIKPNPVKKNRTLWFYGNGTDDGSIIDYYWASNISGFLSNERFFSISDLDVGIHEISFEVKDDYGKWSEKVKKTIIVNLNLKPIAKIESITPAPSKKGEMVHFNENSQDLDGIIVLYQWDFDGNEIFDWNSTITGDTSFIYDSLGFYNVKLRVTDDDGDYDIATLTIYVNNTPPEVKNLSINPMQPKTTNDLILNYTYFDEDEDLENNTILKWYKNEGYGFNLTNFITKKIDFENTKKGDIWKCEVIPNDGLDLGNSYYSSEIKIISTEPNVKNIIISPENPSTLDNLVVEYEYFDIDLDKEFDTEFSWYKDSGNGFIEVKIYVNYVDSEKTRKGEIWKCEITPGNKFEIGKIFSSEIVKIENTEPKITNITILPEQPYTTNELSLNYTFFDADTDIEIGTLYNWFKDSGNGFFDSGIKTKIVSAKDTIKNQKWKCFVKPSDSEDFGDGVWSNVNEILNSIPKAVISSPIDNDIFGMDNQIIFDGSSSFDNDFDELSYKWTSDIEGDLGNEKEINKKLSNGNHLITLEVSDNLGVKDSISINISVLYVPPVSFYDFRINEIYIDGIPRVNQSINIYAKIQNIGNNLGSFKVMFYEDFVDNKYLIGINDNEPLKKANFINISVNWRPKIEGNHKIIVIVESVDNLELNLDDNRAETIVEVQSELRKDDVPFIQTPVFLASVGIFSILAISSLGTEIGKYKFLLLFFIPLYTRLKKDKLLDNEARGMIRGYIIANPGDHYSSIKRVLRFKNGTLMYHLEILEKNGLIRSDNLGTTKRYYPVGYRSPNTERVLEYIKGSPGISQKEIIRKVKLKQQTVSRILNQMIENGTIRAEKIGRKKSYYVIEKDITDIPFKNCPFCGNDFKLGKTPKFCPYCKESLK